MRVPVPSPIGRGARVRACRPPLIIPAAWWRGNERWTGLRPRRLSGSPPGDKFPGQAGPRRLKSTQGIAGKSIVRTAHAIAGDRPSSPTLLPLHRRRVCCGETSLVDFERFSDRRVQGGPRGVRATNRRPVPEGLRVLSPRFQPGVTLRPNRCQQPSPPRIQARTKPHPTNPSPSRSLVLSSLLLVSVPSSYWRLESGCVILE